MTKTITLTPYQLKRLLYEESVEGFEGWEASADHNTGQYDSGKSSMVDYEIYLTSPAPEYKQYIAIDGYYNGHTGDVFNENITFTLIEPEVEKKTFVVTDPEAGWDCVRGIYEATSEKEVEEFLLKEQGYTKETKPEFWDDNNVIHESKITKL